MHKANATSLNDAGTTELRHNLGGSSALIHFTIANAVPRMDGNGRFWFISSCYRRSGFKSLLGGSFSTFCGGWFKKDLRVLRNLVLHE